MDASKFFKESKAWLKILEVILAIGNFLNGKNRQRGGVYGFRLESLRQVSF